MRAPVVAFFLLLGVSLSGCREESRAASELQRLADTASRMVLYSLDPTPLIDSEGHIKETEKTFHGYPILGRAEIRDPEERRALLRALADAVRNPPDAVAMCFDPRHGLRIEQGDRTIELNICFECAQMRTHGLADDKTLLISGGEPTFDASLRKHGLRKSKT